MGYNKDNHSEDMGDHLGDNQETEAALQEARDIMSGKTQAKSYNSAEELFSELDEE